MNSSAVATPPPAAIMPAVSASMPPRATIPKTFLQRAGKFLLRHRLLLLLVAADLVTKLAAFALLPHDEPVPLMPGVSLYLAVNEWGVMGGVHGIGAVTANPAYTMMLAFGLLVFALAILRLGTSGLAFGWRVLAGTAVFFGVALAAQAVSVPFAHVALPAQVIVMTIRLAALAVSVAFYAASIAAWPRAAFTLFAAGALGNTASYAYPPFAVIDFLMVPIEPLLALAGRGGESLVGVVNMADLYLFTFPVVLMAWPIAALVVRAGRLLRI
ncbi:MAG: hypothetical protein ABR587_04745 [Candidatus Binatia bacterium]